MMESDEGRSFGRSLREQKPKKDSTSSRLKNSWLGRNWSTVLILVAIVLLALFVRTYFGFSTAVDNGFLVAGGSDSYYHARVIDYVNSEGSHLVHDPALDYPFGMRNARPPIYDWSVAITSQLLSGISGMAISDAAGYSLLASSAIWGALTCIPVYMITKGAFGNRAGILAALLFAFMPGHISRSVFANADHDAMILFFVVFALYFLMKALQSMKGTRWVSSWKDMGAIRSGMRSYFSQNQRSMIYAVLGGTCIATVAMMWTGYTYILIIVLVYFLVQAIINRFRNADTMGEFFIVGIMLLTAFALAAPLYWQLNFWSLWYDVPFYLFVGAMIIGGFFTVTRDYPWTLTIPAIVIIVVVGLIGVYFVSPNLFESIVSGQGYLVKSKLYSTIDEASAPGFSQLVFAFGPVTFWLSIIGLVWAAIKIPKNQSPHYVFVVVWMGVSMYMAASASRFMFNATPAFALAGGWILALLISMAKFTEVPRLWSGFWSNPRSTLRKAFKFRYMAVALFLAFLVVLPNVWTAVDAGIPSQNKANYDKQVYNAMPSFLRPANYDSYSYWYFGAFAYSLPLPDTYWPQAWSWFSTQDNNIAELQDRPAFLSWWDYGFEAIQEGQHPTVADNFQNGYEYAGSFITSQNESDAVALFIVRVLEKSGFTETNTQILEDNGVNVGRLQDIMQNPSNYINEVKNNPLVYGPYDSDLSANNAKYAAARVELEKVGLEDMVTIYNQLRSATGIDIGYFAVDGRLFPWSATSQTIFYAPAMLSDRVIDPTTNAPTDYYEILAVTQNYETKRISDLTASDYPIITYTIAYKEAFYSSMLYRAFMGISPSDIGATSQGIPGISGSLANYEAMPGYNLTHFKQVYRTAYYNPYTDAANHSDAWKAVSWEEALYLKEQIDAGAEGTVDMSSAGLQSGVVFIQYYDGAIVEGTARSADGTPYANIYVTVVDEYGIPHQTVQTDENGHYSVILPFGTPSVVFSSGTLNSTTQIASELGRVEYSISYGQAMREGPEENWTFNGDIVLPGTFVTGSVFYDKNGNGRYDAGEDEYISGADVTLENLANGFSETVTTGALGSYRIIGLAGGSQTLSVKYDGHTLSETTISLTSGATNRSIAVKPGTISGTVNLPSGSAAAGVNLTLEDTSNGKKYYVTTDSNGKYTFTNLLPGNYILYTTDQSLSVGTQSIDLEVGQDVDKDLKLVQATTISGTVEIDGVPQANVPVIFRSEQREISVLTDADGKYVITLPYGEYSVYAVTARGGEEYASLVAFIANADNAALDIELLPATAVTGTVRIGDNATSGASVVYSMDDGSYIKATTSTTGEYHLIIPLGTYFLYSQGSGKSFWDVEVAITDNITMDISLEDSSYLTGKVFNDLNEDGDQDSGESGVSGALLKIWLGDDPQRKVNFVTSSNGNYNISVPAGSYILNVTMDGYTSWQGDAGTSVNPPLIALNRTVDGAVALEDGTPVSSGVKVNFKPTGSSGQEANATTDGSGEFSISLKPGTYWVTIDYDVTGDGSTKYLYNTTLTVPIARDPEGLSIEVAEKYRVDAEIVGAPGWEDTKSSVRLIGPENRTLDAAAPFEDLYLLPGDYTMYIHLVNGDDHYVYFRSVTIGAGANDLGELEVEYASALRGQVQYEDEDLAAQASVEVISDYDGAALTLTANSRGAFDVYLPNGTYTVDAEYMVKATLEDGSSRYVKYHNKSMPVTVDGETIGTFDLTRELNNATLAVTVGDATSTVSWQFVSLSDTAMDHTNTSEATGGSFSLAPGVYSVYAYDIDSSGNSIGNVYLGIVNVRPNEVTNLAINLTAGKLVEGDITYNDGASDVPAAGATVTFTDNAVAQATADSGGHYSIYLPNGYYNVTAKTTVVEYHPGAVDVTHSRSFDLTVNATLPSTPERNIALERQLNGAVEVVWEQPATIPSINPGETVTYSITVYNRGNIDDTYELSTTSTWGVSFSQKTVELPWGSAGQEVQVTITAPTDAKVSHPDIKIVAKSVSRTGAEGSAALKVGINPIYNVSVTQGAAPSTNGTAVTYYVLVKNTGTASDIYDFNLTNVADLLADGWVAKIAGTSEPTKPLTISAGSSQTVTVTLTKNVAEPSIDIVLNVGVESRSSGPSGSASFELQKGDLSVAGDQLTASGRGASMDAPHMTTTTWVLLVLIVLLLVGLVVTRVNKGVFGRRRKR